MEPRQRKRVKGRCPWRGCRGGVSPCAGPDGSSGAAQRINQKGKEKTRVSEQATQFARDGNGRFAQPHRITPLNKPPASMDHQPSEPGTIPGSFSCERGRKSVRVRVALWRKLCYTVHAPSRRGRRKSAVWALRPGATLRRTRAAGGIPAAEEKQAHERKYRDSGGAGA